MYRGPSEFGLKSAIVGKIGRSTVPANRSVVFRQLVGARTVSHEVAGEVGGGGLGVVGAVLAGS